MFSGSFSGNIGFDKITQEQWDQVAAGEPLVSDLVKQYKSLIVSMGFRDMLLSLLKQHTAETVLERLEKERPDLKIGDRANALARIDAEIKRVDAIFAK